MTQTKGGLCPEVGGKLWMMKLFFILYLTFKIYFRVFKNMEINFCCNRYYPYILNGITYK